MILSPSEIKLTAEQHRAWEQQWEEDGQPTDWQQHQLEFKDAMILEPDCPT